MCELFQAFKHLSKSSMISTPFRRVAAAVALVAASCAACAQQADFNEVGKQMAITLQNNHFSRVPFDKELSKCFLDKFLRDLDYQRLYFTQVDVDGFQAKYGDNLHTLLLEKKCMVPANEIYGVFVKRVEARVALTDKLLKEPAFDFAADESVARTRKEAAWPKDEKRATELWRLQVKEAVLSEVLRRELLAPTDVHRPDLVRKTHFLAGDGHLVAVGCRPVVDRDRRRHGLAPPSEIDATAADAVDHQVDAGGEG